MFRLHKSSKVKKLLSTIFPDECHTYRLWLLCNAAAKTNPELSHSEAEEEEAAVSSLSSDVSL